jgi:hypothetical protein
MLHSIVDINSISGLTILVVFLIWCEKHQYDESHIGAGVLVPFIGRKYRW